MDSNLEQEFISMVTDITFLASSTDWDSEISSLFIQLIIAESFEDQESLSEDINSRKPKMEFASLTRQLLMFPDLSLERKVLSLFTQIISLVSFMDLDSQPKPESELISLIKKTISLFSSKPDSKSKLVSLVTQTMRLCISVDSDSEPTQESKLISLIRNLVSLKPEPELTSLIRKIISRFRSMNWEPMQFISLCPQAYVILEQGKFRPGLKKIEQECDILFIEVWRSERQIHFHCGNCNGKNHEGYEKTPVQTKHPLHPQHSLQLVSSDGVTRVCYCCDEDLESIFYHCQACDYAMNFACAKKPLPISPIDHPKWHLHPLVLFPSHDSLTCHLCAIKDSTCLFYICPPCGFVVHQKCLSLPHVIRISRHPHRISFTHSFNEGEWFCSVCRRKINNDYGGYSCIKDGCLYAVHSKCATQSNVWDGKELEDVPEETEEVLKPFLRISDGIIQHFSHQHHHLSLVESAEREFDENKRCQACIMSIYFGNFYSCMRCDFILHEKCANLSRSIYHATHPHMLTLVGGYEGVTSYEDKCSACYIGFTSGFFYECRNEEGDSFRLHVQCATMSEPLVHGIHIHPLFLTSKPTDRRACSVCKSYTYNTFNCIEECEFSLCFMCATIPQKVKYKHDKHTLYLTHGDETSALKYWCEACEKQINPKERFYKCDEYCCVTLHIECLIGKDFYVKPSSSFVYYGEKVTVVANNQHMSRPICYNCKMRCPFQVAFQYYGSIYCSIKCVNLLYRGEQIV